MGCFSWDCPACKHSIRASHATTAVSRWLSEAVLVEPEGDTLRGTYDGYGNLNTRSGREIEVTGSTSCPPCLYHQACYDLLGKPAHTGPSRTARDQGHFVGEYDPKKPGSREEVAALAKVATDKAEADHQAFLASVRKEIAEYQAVRTPTPPWLTRHMES